MTVANARLLLAFWGVAYVICLSWPVIGFFNRIEPRIFGMPFVMAFVVGWLVLGLIVLYILDRAVTADEAENPPEPDEFVL